MIKNSFLSLIVSLFILPTFLMAQDLPKPSPNAVVSQRVGLTDIEITYSRPGVKDRVIFGDLVAYNEIWRTGANKATAINISDDIKVAGKDLKAGSYAIFTVPGEKEWKFIFNSNTEQWGTYDHKDDEDVLTVSISSETSEFTESMNIYFDDLRDASASIVLQWEKTRIKVPITVDVKAKAEENIKSAIDEAQGSFRTYRNSARYYMDNDLDAAQALTWAQKSVDMDKKYWNLTTLSRAQYANGLKKEAIKSAEEALTLSTEAKSKHYIKENEKNITDWKAKK